MLRDVPDAIAPPGFRDYRRHMAATLDPDHTAAFDAATADFGRSRPLLWQPVSAGTVELKHPGPGERVLDACCGDGASAGVGLADVQVHEVEAELGLDDETAWRLVIGTRYRGLVADLSEAEQPDFRRRFLRALRRDGVDRVDVTTLVGVGRVS